MNQDCVDIKYLCSRIESNTPVTIIGCVNCPKTVIEKLYFKIKTDYPELVSMYKVLIYDKSSLTSIYGRETSEVKQILFVNVRNIIPAHVKGRECYLVDSKAFKGKIVAEVCKSRDHIEPPVTLLKNRFSIDKLFVFQAKPPVAKMGLNKLISPENEYFGEKTVIMDRHNYFIFDTETNGLPKMKNYRCSKYDEPNGYDNCRMLSIGWVLTDSKFNVLESHHHLIKNNTIYNTQRGESINKIRDADREENGIDFIEMYDHLRSNLETCSHMISHGSDFDFNLLVRECLNHDLRTDIFNGVTILNTKQYLLKDNYRQCLSDLVSTSACGAPHSALHDAYLCMELLKKRLN